jgi:hypothetical protein
MDKDDIKQDKAMVASAIHAHEKHDHPGKPLTKLKSGGSVSSRADGCCERGKTKGKMV